VPALPEPVEALTDDEAQVIVPEGEVEAQAQAAPVEAAPVQVNAPVESIDGLEIQKGDGFAKAYINGEYAGEVNAAQKGPFISSVVVEPKFQGIGVGRALYAEADKMVEGGIIPSPLGLTERTEVIWKKRLSEMPAGEAARVIERSKEVGRSYGISDGDLSARLDKLMPQQGNTA
jgi:GNAT superfamily N-acetyltransferase